VAFDELMPFQMALRFSAAIFLQQFAATIYA